MQAQDVMRRFVISVSPDTTVGEIAQQLIERGVGMIRRSNLLFSGAAVANPHFAGPKTDPDPSQAPPPARRKYQGSKPCFQRNRPLADP